MIFLVLFLLLPFCCFAYIPCYKPPEDPEEDIYTPERAELCYDEDREMYYVGRSLNDIQASPVEPSLETNTSCVFDVTKHSDENIERASLSWHLGGKRGPLLPLIGGHRRHSVCSNSSTCSERDATEKLLSRLERRQCVPKPGN